MSDHEYIKLKSCYMYKPNYLGTYCTSQLSQVEFFKKLIIFAQSDYIFIYNMTIEVITLNIYIGTP